MDKKKYIICINNGGLGNRLKGLISVMRLSKKLERELVLYWPNTKYCGCDFEDLFENTLPKIGDEELKKIKRGGDYKFYNDVLDNEHEKYKYLLFKTWRFIFLPNEVPKNFTKVFPSKEGRSIDFEFDRIPLDKRKDFLEELNSLKPTQQILEGVKSFEEKYNLSEYNGIHIRRGDTKFTVDGREKVSSDELFIEKIKSMPNERFLLCTDGIETENKLKELFGDKIIVYPKGDRKRSRKDSLQEALIDMLLLSKTKRLLGSYLSTFTELAWWFGGCKNKIEIIGIENVNKSPTSKTFLQKIVRKLKFYKVNFLRWIFRSYK